MDYHPSQDYHQGKRSATVDTHPDSRNVGIELQGIELYIRALEDSVKRLDAAPKEAFTVAHLHKWEELTGRLFELTK